MGSSITDTSYDQLGPPKKIGPIDVWFDDGNLLVVVGDKRFSVFAGILSAASTIFRDMFHVSRMPDRERIDGRAVVHLEGDSAEDVSFLLKTMHDMEFFLPPPAQAPFAIVAGILRTSTKYDVPILLQRALLHLSSVYPTSIEDFDASSGFLVPSIHDHYGAVRLAREFDLQWIRPIAMYRCMSVPFSQTYRAFEEASLSAEDQRLCLSAIEPLKSAQFVRYKFLMNFVKCTTKPTDPATRHGILAKIMAEEGPHILSKTFEGGLDVCSTCLSSMTIALKDSRAKAWETIPSIFQCQPWENLAQLCRESSFICGNCCFPEKRKGTNPQVRKSESPAGSQRAGYQTKAKHYEKLFVQLALTRFHA
ncbi:hypothetical protein BDZ94DRAFT_1338504 [Collybia nuda]|uniref:BTB domain-containing protein n=1 Tax=Collybia nuda TaxID=64659 RepID=A0A9P5XXT3_9AGAR|nr:hypothetical protein BDZ94DRAFT_1338504 [Collybia nuda]